MREITEHHINECNECLKVHVMDREGPGGANHHYRVDIETARSGGHLVDLRFQNGAIKEAGVNGLTHEVLLAIIADRLRAFQAGPYACTENKEALEYIEGAQAVLKKRTARRVETGVEGTMQLDKPPVAEVNGAPAESGAGAAT